MAIYYIMFPLVFFFISVRLAKRDFLLAVAFLLVLQVFLKVILYKTIPGIAFASGTFINITTVLLFIYYAFKEPSLLKRKIAWMYLGAIFTTLLYLVLLAMFQGYPPFQHVLFVRNYFFNFLLFLIFISLPQKVHISAAFHIRLIIALTMIMAFLCLLQYLFPIISEFFKIVETERFGEIRIRLTEIIAKQKLITGTFNSPQGASSFLLMNIIFLYNKMVVNLLHYSVHSVVQVLSH